MDLDINLEMGTKENMYYNNSYTEYNEENVYPQQIYYDNRECSVNQEDQIMEHCEETQPAQQQTQTVQHLYKLNNIDTEATIKTEIKQLISTKISEEINSKILDDTTYEVEEQISNLKTKTESLQNKIQELDKEVESDSVRLTQSELTLEQTAEVIGLLKENVDKLFVQNRESRINEISTKSFQQRENLESFKKNYMIKIDKQKEYLKKMETSITEHNEVLKLEVVRKEEVLKSLQKRQEELKGVSKTYDEEIEKNITKKLVLEKKLESITNKKTTIEDEFMEQNDLLNNLSLKNENQLEKFRELNKEKKRIEKQLEQELHEQDVTKAKFAQQEDQILKRAEELKILRDRSKLIKDQCQETLRELRQNHNNITEKLNERETILATCESHNNQLLTKMNQLNNKYIHKCEDKLGWINRNLEQQDTIYKIKLNLLKKEMEGEIKHKKLEDLKNRHETTLTAINSLENDIKTEHETASHELTEIKLKFEVTRADYNKYFLELRKKKEYLLVNSKFLEEKSENLRSELKAIEKLLQTLNEKNTSVKVLIENKLKQLEECKINLNALKKSNGSETPLKTGLKSPKNDNLVKKVQFNEILSFKSPSSSEMSNVPGETATQLERSFQDWLQNTKEPADVVEIIDEEF